MTGFATNAAFDAYVMYMAMKKHFSDKKYDFFKYHGKVKASYDKFQTRPDVYSFNKLSKKKEAKDLLLANLVNNPSAWIMDILNEDGASNYKSWRKTMEAFTYYFTQDIEKLDDDLEKNLLVKNSQLPPIMQMMMARDISLETLTVIGKRTNVIQYWCDMLKDDVIGSDISTKISKYAPFIEVDMTKVTDAMKMRW